MSIGLYDEDYIIYHQVPFNLEIMKLSSYYKSKREIVGLSSSFSPERYSKFYYRKDYYDDNFQPYLYKYKNLEYGGLAFTNNIYSPLDEEIEKVRPDPTIYLSKSRMFVNNKDTEEAFKTMYNAQHLRLSLDGANLWEKFTSQIINRYNTSFFFHDFNLNGIKDSQEIIRNLVEFPKKGMAYGRISSKFPIKVNNEKDLLKWANFYPSKNFFPIEYSGVINDEVFSEFIILQKGTSISRQFTYIPTAAARSEEDFIEYYLQRIFRQVCFLRMNRIPISLKYEDNFFKHKEWENVFKLINSYCNIASRLKIEDFKRIIKFDTMYSFASKGLREEKLFTSDIFTKDEARELFRFVKDNDYKTFKDFYECSTVTLRQGVFEKNE